MDVVVCSCQKMSWPTVFRRARETLYREHGHTSRSLSAFIPATASPGSQCLSVSGGMNESVTALSRGEDRGSKQATAPISGALAAVVASHRQPILTTHTLLQL